MRNIQGEFGSHPYAFLLRTKTPGVRVVVAQTRKLLVLVEDRLNGLPFADVIQFLYNNIESSHPSNLGEYLEGAGGINDFASIAVQHIKRNVTDTHLYKFFELNGLFRLLVEIHDDGGPISTALLHQGIKGFALLNKMLDAFPGYKVVAEALKYNLFGAIASCARRDGTALHAPLSYFLDTVLPRSMASSSIVKVIAGFPGPVAMQDDLFRDDELRISCLNFNRLSMHLRTTWRQYTPGLTKSSELLGLDIGFYQPIFGCDNMECGRLGRRNESNVAQLASRPLIVQECVKERIGIFTNIRRFAPTLELYISPIHHCVRVRAAFSMPGPATITRRTSFLGAMYEHPGDAFYLLCDYTKGFVTLEVRSARTQVPPPDPCGSHESSAEWEDQVSRAARSRGQMELVVAIVADGTRMHRRMTALRTSTSALNDELRRIAAGIPPGVDRNVLATMVLDQTTQVIQQRRARGDHAVE
ncbi:hypothetical protein C8R43DRAFT_965194 [Mycena crocata]|nr:hypothetical protein C8R43DRAFT_965194 [Mycena crocata]